MGDPAPATENQTSAPAGPRSLPIPTTFGGVAALGLGPVRWLVTWQILLALGAAATVAWALDTSLGRELRRAADHLPDQAAIRGGRLVWPGRTGEVLVQGPFLGIVVNPNAARDAALTSDFTVSVEVDRLAIRSLLGWLEIPYPSDANLSLGRLDVSGGLAGWTQPALLAAGVTVFFGLLMIWWILGLAYGIVLWMVSAPSRKAPTLGEAWQLANAALLLPGVLMTSAMALYATRDLGLVGLLAAIPVHIVAGWVYCLGGLTRLPGKVSNPFGTTPEIAPPPSTEPANPFAPR